MTRQKFGLGLIMGALVGTVAGLLTAPKSGRETREELKHKAEKTKKDMAAKAQDAKTKAREKAAQARSRAEETRDRATRAADSAREAFKKESTNTDTGTTIDAPSPRNHK